MLYQDMPPQVCDWAVRIRIMRFLKTPPQPGSHVPSTDERLIQSFLCTSIRGVSEYEFTDLTSHPVLTTNITQKRLSYYLLNSRGILPPETPRTQGTRKL